MRDAQERAKRLAVELSNRLLAGERLADRQAVTLGDVARLFEREVLPGQAPRSQDESRRKFLRQLCRFATEYRLPDGRYLLAGDPGRGLEIPKETDPKRPLIDEDRYDKLLKAATVRLKPLLILAHDTGRRISAIVALRWDDWCPTEGLYGAIVWRAAHDKVGRTWRVPVTQAVRDAIAGLERRGPYLFPTHADADRPITRTVATNWLRQAERRAKLEHLPGGGWHMFRRAWATSRKHLSLKDVAYAGGWTETSTLLNVYQMPDVESLAQVVEGGREKIRAVR